MNLKVHKYKVLHIWETNLNYPYTMLGSDLVIMTQEKDLSLRVTADSLLKTSAQYAAVTKNS